MAIADRINEMYNHVGDAYDILELAGTNLSNLFNENVEQGAIGSYVGNTYENSKEDSATRIRTVNLIQLDKTKSYTISVKSGYSFAIFTFNDEKKYYDGGHAIWSSNEITITNIPYIALSFKKSSEANIVPSEIDDIQVMLNEGTIALPYAKSVDKNLINLAPTWKERLLYFMNNGTQQVWDNWEKVTGSGTELSLSPTLEAPMKNVLNGNTYQFTTTGKNLLENTFQSQTANGITFTRNDDGSLTFSGTATQAHSITGRFTNDMIFRAGVTYIFSLGNKQAGYGVYLQKTGNVNVWYLGVSATNSSLTITPTEDTTIQQLAIHFPNGNTVNGTIYPMVRLSSVTDSTYEPYTGGQASPNPQYPQDIHVVSGDNNIKVTGKNLFNKDFHIINGFFINSSGGITSDSTLSYQDYFIEVEQNTEYTISSSVSTIYRIAKYDSSKNFIDRQYNENASTSYTINTGNAKYIKMAGTLTTALDSLQIEKNSSATTYEPYIGNTYPINLPNGMELCKIGTYQDRIFKSSGKNLFDNTYNDLGMWITNIGETTTFAQGSQYLGAYCKVEPGTYTISRNKKTNRFRIGVSPNQPTGTTSSCYVVASNDNASSITIDVPQGNNYICVYLSNNSETSTNVDLMIEKGSSATSYEPYGNGEWYKYEPINKIVLDSSSYDGRGDLATANTYRYYFKAPNALVVSNTREVVPLYSNLGLPVDRETAYVGNNGISYFSQANKMQFVFDETKSLSIDDLKDWLDNHYFEVYYLLDTPNYIKITYEPLLEQLEAFYNAKSKNSQTNITQESNDMPFELDVVALSK